MLNNVLFYQNDYLFNTTYEKLTEYILTSNVTMVNMMNSRQ